VGRKRIFKIHQFVQVLSMSDKNAARTNIKYLPCCHGEFDCKDKGKECIHKKTCTELRGEA